MRYAILVLSLLFSLVLSGCVGCNTSPGTGEKIGQIVKVSKVGMMNKTWEAELIRGGMSGGNGSFGTTPFDFTITDDALAAKAQEYLASQTEVILKYSVDGVYWTPNTENSGRFAVSIEPKK